MPDNKELTSEERIELEKTRTERAQAESDRAASDAAAEQAKAETRRLQMQDAIKSEVDRCGIRSYLNLRELMILLRQEPNVVIEPSVDGRSLHVTQDGKDTTFEKLLEGFALRNPTLFDRRTLRAR